MTGPAPALPEARERRKASVLKLGLLVALILGLAMVIQASLKAARKVNTGGDGAGQTPTSMPGR
jgi:hypothetical protein